MHDLWQKNRYCPNDVHIFFIFIGYTSPRGMSKHLDVMSLSYGATLGGAEQVLLVIWYAWYS